MPLKFPHALSTTSRFSLFWPALYRLITPFSTAKRNKGLKELIISKRNTCRFSRPPAKRECDEVCEGGLFESRLDFFIELRLEAVVSFQKIKYTTTAFARFSCVCEAKRRES